MEDFFSSDAQTRKLRLEFRKAFAEELNRPTVAVRQYPGVCTWISKQGYEQYVALDTYRIPSGEHAGKDLVRLSINSALTTNKQIDLTWTYELTMLPAEVFLLLPYVVGLIRSKEESNPTIIPAPAVPLVVWGTSEYRSNYVWTATADELAGTSDAFHATLRVRAGAAA